MQWISKFHSTEMNCYKDDRGFKIVDNVLHGDEAPINRDPINVGELVLEALRSRPDLVGQIDGLTGKKTSYAEMTEKSVKCAIWLKKQGIGPTDLVGICAGNILDAYVPLFAAFYVNAVANTWDEELTKNSGEAQQVLAKLLGRRQACQATGVYGATAKYFLSLTRPRVVFVGADSARSVREAANEENLEVRLVVFEESESSTEFQCLADILKTVEETEMERFRCTEISHPDEPSMICCSSGTTGFPKGSEISHSSLVNYLIQIEVMDMRNHVSMWTPPIRWHFGLALVVKAVLDYSTRIVVDHYIDDIQLCQIIEKHKVSWFASGPGVPTRLLKFGIIPKFRLPSLKVFLLGGSPFKAEAQQALKEYLPHTAVIHSYGMTDVGGMSTYQKPSSKNGSCGLPCRNVRLKVVDVETGRLLGPNQTGELWISSPFVMTGYYRNPEATKRMIDPDGYVHSGDVAYYDEDGELYVVGRISDFIIYKSINVPPAQIEALLESHPAVLEAAVVGLPHDTDDEHPIAFVTRLPGKQVTEAELIKLVDQNLEFYSRLRAGVRFIDQFPRSATGKISKTRLKEMAIALHSK